MREMPIPRVSVCILNWNGWQDTLECLESVQGSDYPEYKTVVLDNGSEDDSVQRIKTWCRGKLECVEYDREMAERGGQAEREAKLNKEPSGRRLVLIRTRQNLGFAEGNNVAIRYALRCAEPADYVFVLNNDTRIDPACISQAVEVSIKEKADVVGCVIRESGNGKLLFSGDHRPPELFYMSYYWFRHRLKGDEPSNMAWGTAMLVSQKALLDTDARYGRFFNPRLFLYAEDNDFSMRMLALGYKIFLASRALVYHKHNDSCINKKHRNSFLLYYATRNTVWVAKHHLSGLWLVFFYVYYPVVRIKDVLLRLKQGKIREASNILEGLWDGFRRVEGKWKKQREC